MMANLYLSEAWLVGALLEHDFKRPRVGSEATMGGPNGICHLVGQFLRFPLKGTAFRA